MVEKLRKGLSIALIWIADGLYLLAYKLEIGGGTREERRKRIEEKWGPMP